MLALTCIAVSAVMGSVDLYVLFLFDSSNFVYLQNTCSRRISLHSHTSWNFVSCCRA